MSRRFFFSRKNSRDAAGLTSRLDKRIIIQSPVDIPDGGGGVSRSWSDIVSVWAHIMPLTGRETLRFGQLQSSYTHQLVIRFRDDVTTAMRASYGGKVFYIQSVRNPEEKSVWLELFVEEREGA